MIVTVKLTERMPGHNQGRAFRGSGEMMERRHVFDGKVVPLDGIRNAMKFPAIAQVDAYWEGLRRGRAMPDRAEVDPRGLEGALEFAFMLEQIAPSVGRMRVAGMHLADILGMEVRGMPLTAFFEPASRERVGQVLADVVTTPKVADLLLTSDRGLGRPALSARLYLAPLSNGDGNAMRVLGCLQSSGGLGRTPRRFRVQLVQMRRIVSTETHIPAPAAPVPAFSEDAAIFRHAPRGSGPAKHPHLRLVKTGN